MLATVVDLAALWKILAAAVLISVGVTGVFARGAIAAERWGHARRSGDVRTLVLSGAVLTGVAIVCLGVLALGVVAMTHK